MHTLFYEGSDLAQAEEFFTSAYSKTRIASTGPSAPTRVRRYDAGVLTLDRLEVGFDMSYALEPLGRIALMSLRSGHFPEHRTDGVDDSFAPGDVVSLAAPDRPYEGRVRDADYLGAMFDAVLFGQVAATDSDRPVQLTGHRPVTPAAGRQLTRTMTYVYSLLADQGAPDSPLLLAAAGQLIAAAALAALPSNAVFDPTALDRRDARPQTVRRAIAYIESDPLRDMAVGDIAAAACVTVRALQLAFRRHLGCTPMEYVRRIRLDGAHRELATADPAQTSVAAVAARWGFVNGGRFAALHRSVYGTTPTQALRT
jgi:AraC-like DNA-binding protein